METCKEISQTFENQICDPEAFTIGRNCSEQHRQHLSNMTSLGLRCGHLVMLVGRCAWTRFDGALDGGHLVVVVGRFKAVISGPNFPVRLDHQNQAHHQIWTKPHRL